MLEHLAEANDDAVPLLVVGKAELTQWLATQPDRLRHWAKSADFTGDLGAVCLVPGPDGQLSSVLVGAGDDQDPWLFAHLPAKLPPGFYRAPGSMSPEAANWAALAWMLATYSFARYKAKPAKAWPKLVWPHAANRGHVERSVEAAFLVRDLINTPAADMGPADLADAATQLAGRFGAKVKVIAGDDLLAENYPAIHAVGRASAPKRQPRLIDLVWGEADAAKVTLVGKGVCFDTGGLDIKPSGNMRLMKKDMGGAAHVLGLASMIMAAGLPVRLRVLIPAVENSVSGDSMRPLDVLQTRKGMSVEVGNTDAEGRLVLADALWEAADEKPDLLIDIATLTGAARVALGTDLPALFANNDSLAEDILAAGESDSDPLWRLPLHKPYRRMLDSKVADINNISESPHAGAILAALFLNEFVPDGIPWAHLDIMAWNGAARPGRPDGGEAMALRALYGAVTKRFGGR